MTRYCSCCKRTTAWRRKGNRWICSDCGNVYLVAEGK